MTQQNLLARYPAVPPSDVGRLARDRQRAKETELLQLDIAKIAGDAVDDDRIKKVEDEAKELRELADAADAKLTEGS